MRMADHAVDECPRQRSCGRGRRHPVATSPTGRSRALWTRAQSVAIRHVNHDELQPQALSRLLSVHPEASSPTGTLPPPQRPSRGVITDMPLQGGMLGNAQLGAVYANSSDVAQADPVTCEAELVLEVSASQPAELVDVAEAKSRMAECPRDGIRPRRKRCDDGRTAMWMSLLCGDRAIMVQPSRQRRGPLTRPSARRQHAIPLFCRHGILGQ